MAPAIFEQHPMATSKPESSFLVEDVLINEDDELQALGSPLTNRTPSQGEWMEPVSAFFQRVPLSDGEVQERQVPSRITNNVLNAEQND